MAVYFEPRQPGWADYIAPAAQELLRGLVGGMFDRDKQARDLKHQNSLADAEQARKQEAIDRALAYVGDPGNTFDIRGNPEAASRSYMGAALQGVPVDKIMETFGRPMQMQTTDLEDRARIGTFDPVTGQMQGQDHAYGLNPTQKYAQDEATQRQQMADKAANYRAGVAAQARPMGVMGASKSDPKATLGAYTKLIELYMDPVSNLPLPGYADFVAGLTNEVRGLISSMASGGKPPNAANPQGDTPSAPQQKQPKTPPKEMDYDPKTRVLRKR